MGAFAQAATPVCRHHIQESLSILKASPRSGAGSPASRKTLDAWHATPELYRRMVVHAAGLGREVVDKLGAQLTESERVMLQSAIDDMRLSLPRL